MYFRDEIYGFLGLASEIWYGVDSAPFGVEAEAAELSLVEYGGEGTVGEGEGDWASEKVVLVWSSFKYFHEKGDENQVIQLIF